MNYKDIIEQIKFDPNKSFSKYLDQKMTHVNLYLSCFILRLFDNKKIDKKELNTFFVNSIKNNDFLFNIFKNEKSNNINKRIIDQKRILEESISILEICNILKINNNYIEIINYEILDEIISSDINNLSLNFLIYYFKKILKIFDLYDYFIELILESKNKVEFERNNKNKLVNNMKEKLDSIYGNKYESIINLKRILNKPIQYISFKIDNKWYTIDELCEYNNKYFLNRDKCNLIFKNEFNLNIKNDSSKNIENTLSALKTIENELKDIKGDLEKEIMIKARMAQGNFRESLLKIYPNECLLSGIKIKDLLIASHIKPWSESDDIEKVNPMNGFLLSASIDKLFDRHLISFDENGKLYISNKLKDNKSYEDVLIKIGIDKDYIDNKKSIFDKIDSKYHDGIKVFLDHHYKKTKNNK